MARRIKSLHHNLGDKNVVFHREHRSKRRRRNQSRFQRLLAVFHKKRQQELKEEALSDDIEDHFKR